jgi:hypothetical protein
MQTDQAASADNSTIFATDDTVAAASSNVAPQPLRSGVKLPFTVSHASERALFERVLHPASERAAGYRIDYELLDAWILETEHVLHREFANSNLPSPFSNLPSTQPQQHNTTTKA